MVRGGGKYVGAQWPHESEKKKERKKKKATTTASSIITCWTVPHMLTLLKYIHVPADAPAPPDVQDSAGIELRRFQPEQKEENKSSFAPPSITSDLNSCCIALLGLQEVMGYYWLDIEGLVLVSLLSIRARQIASNGRYWRSAVRATFPMHPFEVCCWWV